MADQDRGLMTFFESEAHSFVLRIWLEHRDKTQQAGEWRGWVDHVQSGRRFHFREFDEIGRIISGIVDPVEQAFMPIQPDTQNP